MSKRKTVEEPEAPAGGRNTVEIIPLGAGQEVGRSCIILKYLGKTIMLDCGIHPGHHGIQSLPFFDDVDLEEVDIALITHFHLDHCAAVPYLACKTKFKGRIFMTHPTKAVYAMLLQDFARVGSSENALFTHKDVESSMSRIEVIDFHQTITVDGVQICAYRAGHVLGAAMFMVEIAGMRCLYTGDYSRAPDRHMPPADLPDLKPDIVIVEATYGVSSHQPREEREELFCARVRDIVQRGGRVLLPCVALGRAQELMLILEEFWSRNGYLQHTPIYTISGIAARALGIYQTYIEMMGEDIKQAFAAVRNPFQLQHVQHLKSTREFHETGSCVVMATPSGLQGGASRDLFDAWCSDPRNGLIIADFAVQGTLAREVLGEPSHVLTRHGSKVPLRMSVDAVSFSAHADFPQTAQFVEALAPRHVVLVHGEVNEMLRLRRALEQQAQNADVQRTLHMPKDAQSLLLYHRPLHVAKAGLADKHVYSSGELGCLRRPTVAADCRFSAWCLVVGRLADKPPQAGMALEGLLVRQGLKDVILHQDDLATFTKLRTGAVLQKQSMLLARPWMQARLALEIVFEGAGGGATPDLGAIQGLQSDGNRLLVCGSVQIGYTPGKGTTAGRVDLEWQGSHQADLIADACVAVLMQASMDPPGVRAAQAARRVALRQQDPDAAERAEVALLVALLGAQFGAAQAHLAKETITLQVDETLATVHHKTGKVQCENASLQARVAKAVMRLRLAMGPASRDDTIESDDEDADFFEPPLKVPVA